jgi:putative SOS response-associated peptidase YedK
LGSLIRLGFQDPTQSPGTLQWDRWAGQNGPLLTCYILTTAVNDQVRRPHDKMPAAFTPARFAAWPNPLTPADAARWLLRPLPPSELETVAVSPLADSPKNDRRELLVPPG